MILYYKNDYIKYTILRQTYSGRKISATGYVYLNGSPYRDAEGSSQLISCLHDEIINVAPIIWEKLTDPNCIDSVHLEGLMTQKYKSWKNVKVYHLK